MENHTKIALALALCALPCLAQADIYKSVDADGNVTYSSSPSPGAKKLNLEPLPTMQPVKEFPKVDRETQKARDDTRRKILEDELASEKKLLETAKQNLADGESNPEVFRGENGKIYRNVAKYQEKIKPLQDEVDLHTKNIEAIETEISRLPR
jgi:hypothetical protein